jgi:hypothetical protein
MQSCPQRSGRYCIKHRPNLGYYQDPERERSEKNMSPAPLSRKGIASWTEVAQAGKIVHEFIND